MRGKMKRIDILRIVFDLLSDIAFGKFLLSAFDTLRIL